MDDWTPIDPEDDSTFPPIDTPVWCYREKQHEPVRYHVWKGGRKTYRTKTADWLWMWSPDPVINEDGTWLFGGREVLCDPPTHWKHLPGLPN